MPETVVHFQIRMPPELHERLASQAKEQRTSLNLMVVDILRQAAEEQQRSGTDRQKANGKR